MAVSTIALRDALVQSFNLGELNTLCFELDIVYENLGGQGLEGKALSLVQHAMRHGLYDRLVASVQYLRPHLDFGVPPKTTDAGPAALPGKPVASIYAFYGPVTGSAIGESSVQAQNIAGGDIIINYNTPQNRDEFAAQLAQLESLLKEAIANGEIKDNTAIEDMQDAIEEVKKPEPSSRRLKNRLEDVQEVVEGAGGVVVAARKSGSAVIKALPIVAGLIKVTQNIF